MFLRFYVKGIVRKSSLDIDFVADHPKNEYCHVILNEDSYQAFLYAIKNHYWYQMYIDDLPIWGV